MPRRFLTICAPHPRLQCVLSIREPEASLFSQFRGNRPRDPCSMEQPKPPPAPPPRPAAFSLELGEKEAEGVYSNLCVISHSSSEVILDFARTLPGTPKSRVYARVIMTPQHAKSLQQALTANLAKYEEQFGAIRNVPGTAEDPDRKSIGF